MRGSATYKVLLKLLRAVWLLFFFAGLLAGVDYVFSRDDLSFALFMGGVATAALPWSIVTRILPDQGIYLLVRGVCYLGLALLNYYWIAHAIRRASAKTEWQVPVE